ncbi:hypothetical protein Tco_0895948 [Tanacetum coccineum]|uniref:DUF4283 domain-containing protein n=1 Tax=Tanacetum coccineum TaxID=301880 RepID=A0ABQ5CJF4_9ASTR
MEKGFLYKRRVKEKENNANIRSDITSRTRVTACSSNEHTNNNDIGNKGNHVSEADGSSNMFESSYGNTNDVNTDNVNLETPLESNKDDDVNTNANVEPTASASLLAFVSFATLLKGDASQKSLNSYTLITPARKGVDVVVPLESIRVVSERFANSAYGFFLGKWVAYPVVANYVRNTWSKYGLADVELKDTIMVAMPKLVGEGFYMCAIRVEYEWKPPRCLSCKVFGYVLNECPKKIVPDVVKNSNNPRKATRGVPVGQNVSFKSTKQVYKPVCKKNGAITSGNMKQAEVVRQEVAEMGSLNVAHGSSSNTPIIDKIDKLERQIIYGKLMFVDDDRISLISTNYVDNESEVEVVFDETTNLMPSKISKGENDRGYSNNSMLEQWRETNRDDDYDPYDDDLYESHDMSNHLQAIWDNLNIIVCGRMKKYIMFDS